MDEQVILTFSNHRHSINWYETFKHPITVYRFNDAPEELKAYSTSGGDEDWIAVIPNTFKHEHINWLDSLGVCAVETYKLDCGFWIAIGSHA